MNDYWNSAAHVTLPVKRVNGHWELLYGGDTGVRDGTYGELRVAVSSIEDAAIRERLTKITTVKALDEGAELRVALRDPSGKPINHEEIGIDVSDLPSGCTRWEAIKIGPQTRPTTPMDSKRGGLWIRQRGVDRTDLVCSSVAMPEQFKPGHATAISLNHACTLLSEKYETQRISHTLNVYQHVFYCESGSSKPRWLPLDVLRNGVIADMEHGILADAWKTLEQQLGFRPMPKPEANSRGRRRNR